MPSRNRRHQRDNNPSPRRTKSTSHHRTISSSVRRASKPQELSASSNHSSNSTTSSVVEVAYTTLYSFSSGSFAATESSAPTTTIPSSNTTTNMLRNSRDEGIMDDPHSGSKPMNIRIDHEHDERSDSDGSSTDKDPLRKLRRQLDRCARGKPDKEFLKTLIVVALVCFFFMTVGRSSRAPAPPSAMDRRGQSTSSSSSLRHHHAGKKNKKHRHSNYAESDDTDDEYESPEDDDEYESDEEAQLRKKKKKRKKKRANAAPEDELTDFPPIMIRNNNPQTPGGIMGGAYATGQQQMAPPAPLMLPQATSQMMQGQQQLQQQLLLLQQQQQQLMAMQQQGGVNPLFAANGALPLNAMGGALGTTGLNPNALASVATPAAPAEDSLAVIEEAVAVDVDPEPKPVEAEVTPVDPNRPTDAEVEEASKNIDLSGLENFAESWDSYTEKYAPFFWHIPKAGGSSIKDIMGACHRFVMATEFGVTDGHIEDTEIAIVYPKVPGGGGGDRSPFVNVDTSTVAGIERAAQMGFADANLAEAVVSPFLWEANALFTQTAKGRLFSVFRHPVDRAISMFYYIQVADWEPSYAPELQSWTLQQYAESDRIENNWMTRQLSNTLGGDLDDSHLRLAMEVIRRKFLVGIMKRLEESMTRFEKFFHWTYHVNPPNQEACRKRLTSGGSNSNSKNKKDKPKPGEPVWELIAAQNLFDIQLYEYIETLFEEQEAFVTGIPDNFREVDATCCKCDPPTYPPEGFECPQAILNEEL